MERAAAPGATCTWAKAKATAKGKAAKTAGKVHLAKDGGITVKKGAKKGTYTLAAKVAAPATANYASATKTIQLKVKVK